MKSSTDVGEWYKAFLREMKRRDIKVADLPKDVAKSMLYVHQAALLEEVQKRLPRCSER